jgi:hypothetical protein
MFCGDFPMLELAEDSSFCVKLITDPETIEFYSDILTRKHYLGSSAVNRNTLMHVVRRGRDDVAILTWEPKVRLWFGLRDKLIGWTKEQKQQRLQYCVENRRFCPASPGNGILSRGAYLVTERVVN